MPNGHRVHPRPPLRGAQPDPHDRSQQAGEEQHQRTPKPELGQLSAHWRGILGGNCAAVSARRPGVAARLLSLPGVRRDGWFQ
jgi:hypothetical protein